jgi:hypothetical protein
MHRAGAAGSTGDDMPRSIAAFVCLLGLATWGASADCASAQTGSPPALSACAPHCDYTHYYGPYDFTYVRPGLFAFATCGPTGECSPALVSSGARAPIGRITVRTRARVIPPR